MALESNIIIAPEISSPFAPWPSAHHTMGKFELGKLYSMAW